MKSVATLNTTQEDILFQRLNVLNAGSDCQSQQRHQVSIKALPYAIDPLPVVTPDGLSYIGLGRGLRR